MHSSETAVALSVAVLASVFVGALLALLMICRKYCAICRINIVDNSPRKKNTFNVRYDSYFYFIRNLTRCY